MDAAEPSTNGRSAQNLHRLAALLDDAGLAARARAACAAFAPDASQHPFLFAGLLQAVAAGRLGVRAVVVCGEGRAVERALAAARRRVGANETLARLGGAAPCGWLRRRNALFRGLDPGRPRVQVCEAGVCTEELEAGDAAEALG